MDIACLDLEGVLVPEIWIAVAERTGIDALRATTRDVPDYDQLMCQRLALLQQARLGLADVQQVIAGLEPLPGAAAFLHWLRQRFQVLILSDTFYEFAMPLMRQLGYPALLCHRLEVDTGGRIVGYRLRQRDPKRAAVMALQALNYRVVAAGDSYNDATMLTQADYGVLFDPPAGVAEAFAQLPVARGYEQLQTHFGAAAVNAGPAAEAAVGRN